MDWLRNLLLVIRGVDSSNDPVFYARPAKKRRILPLHSMSQKEESSLLVLRIVGMCCVFVVSPVEVEIEMDSYTLANVTAVSMKIGLGRR